MKKGLIVAIILSLTVALISGCAGISPPSEEDRAVESPAGWTSMPPTITPPPGLSSARLVKPVFGTATRPLWKD